MKQLIKAALRSVGLELRRVRRFTPETAEDFVRAGRLPFGPGYHQAKQQLIEAALADPGLLQAFRAGGTLPAGYGVGIDERCVEYPWLFSHLQPGPERLLDAGSVLNHEFILRPLLAGGRKLHVLTLAPEPVCHWQLGAGYLYEDLRDIPVRDALYDTVVCLSTLEHVGCDNTLYGAGQASGSAGAEGLAAVARELKRVLRPGGQVLFSVPFGAYEHHGTFQQFDLAWVQQTLAAFGSVRDVSSVFYRYTAEGWNMAKAEECAGCHYVAWSHRPWPQWPPVPLPVEPDRAAAARAVACVRLVKG